MTETQYNVARANSATAKKWKNERITWAAFVEWQRNPRRTDETQAEYQAMSKQEQVNIKNGAAYVAGYLTGGKRNKTTIKSRSLLTLDADNATPGLWADYCLLIGARACLYSTHSHTADKPKFRLVVALDREVSPDEYVPLAMKIAETVGLKNFDTTTYQPERLMYKSSCSTGARFVFEELHGSAPLCVDEYLALYPDWRDASCWPVQGVIPHSSEVAKVQDPCEKPGIIGAFCRCYDVERAITEFLADTYTPAGEGRYTYAGGSTFGGVVVYEGGKWAFSNHATDPAGGKLVNAFDLVRLHKWGELDEEAKDNTPAMSLPSAQKALDFALAQDEVSIELARAQISSAALDFAAFEESDADTWLGKISKHHRTGAILPSADNINLVFNNDPGLKNKIRHDVTKGLICVVADVLPWRRIKGGYSLWRDSDDASLRIYFETRYGIEGRQKISDVFLAVAEANEYDPVREYLEGLPEWDGVPRVDTLFVDLMGAEDSDYAHAVTRKTLCAAVKRALVPGCKSDHMLILEGKQGIGKSSAFQLLAGRWFTDSLSLADLSRDKVAAEKIQGAWICEVAELDGMAKADIGRLKGFLTSTTDKYRAAYAKNTAEHPRRGIIVGSVNNLEGYLRDATGNRRFWPLRLHKRLDCAELGADAIAQVWAEAKVLLELGEPLYLSGEVERVAQLKQREAMETDPRESIIEKYLETPIPPDFDSWEEAERRDFWAPDFTSAEPAKEGYVMREKVSIIEVWTEALEGLATKPTRQDSYQISAILKRLGWEPTGRADRLKAYGKPKTFERGEKGACPASGSALSPLSCLSR